MHALARAALAALLLACTTAALAMECGTVQPLVTAQRTVTGAGAAADGTQTVPLPDALPRALRNERVQLRYELDVSACAGNAAAALWLFRVSGPYRVVAKGQPLALLNARALLTPSWALGDARLALEGVHNGRIPALFALPPGATRVTVELLTLPFLPSGVVRTQLGPTNLLLPTQADAAESAVAAIDAASVVLLVVSLLAVLLWLPRRSDRSLLWLAVACGLWGLRGLVFFGHKVYGHPMAFEQFNSLNVLLTSGALSVSILHLLGGPQRVERQAIGTAVLLGTTAFPLAAWIGQGATAARALALFLPFCMVTWVLWRAWRAPARRAPWRKATLVAGIATLLGCGAHDLMLLTGRLPADAPSYLFWGFVALLMGMLAMSGQYVVLTLNRAERSNEELEQHVARKTTELELSYAQLRANEQESVRVHERERLLRDMHDGLGAQLMTALRGVERGALAPAQIAQSLQDSLDELRLLMDSTDMGHYLPGALAAWRNRWDGRLAAAGVTLDWRIDESLDQVQLSSEKAMQVMRILQEAATNIVKHAQARHMSLAAQVRQQDGRPVLCIEIADDGIGLGPATPRAGARGLKNMQYRAGEIGAVLRVEGLAAPLTGCLVALAVPLA